MKFGELCNYFEKIESTTKRLEKTSILTELLTNLELSEVRIVINLALGQLEASHERVQFGLAEKMLIRAISLATSNSQNQGEEYLVKKYKQMGDIGELAYELIGQAKNPKNQDIGEIFKDLVKIARDSGTGSQNRKLMALSTLLTHVSAKEAKYIVRIVNESLRLGFSEATILDVISTYAVGDKSASSKLERVYQMRPDPALLAYEVVANGIESALTKIGIELGVPVISALAQRLESVDEMIEKMGKVVVEPKLDGTRVQIHFSRKKIGQIENNKNETQTDLFREEKPECYVRSFTRNLDENTAQFPELMEIESQIKAEDVILDSEAVGYDPKSGKLLPFQMTITRKRKHGVGAAAESVPLRFFVFDVIYYNGESLIDWPLSKRRELLTKIIDPGKVLTINEGIVTDKVQVIRDYHKKQLELGYEGVLVKKVDGKYEPGRTGFNWVKLKEVEESRGKLPDTVDLVVMGYYRGKGKRSGFGIGAFLVGVKDGEEILTIAKIGTGLTDEQFRDLRSRLSQSETKDADSSYNYPKELAPDVWVAPKVVVEVAADEITISPMHTAGYALRFPRLVRIREDKGVSGLTTKTEIKQMAKIGVRTV